ncbi:MAG: PD-(D/E)XK nuclease family protein [Firmicutes bacterium]|nr:PD-(D/E)XK nuclease family protein [Bacillota bacterium]
MKIITSNTSRGAYRGVMNTLKQHLGESNIVIAPDRFTASVERGIISTLELESSFGIDVMSFTRLANKLVGKDIKKCLTPEGSVMLIGKVIADRYKDFKYYGKVALADGFASELYAALTAIRNSGISTEMLSEELCKMTPALKAKTQDIILIYEGYLDALSGRHSDSSTRLNALAQYINEHPESVAATNFYCTDIYEFSAPELEIVAGLAKNALSLTVGLVSGYDGANRRIYPDRVINKLKSVCRDRVTVERNDEKLIPPIEAISTQLFSYGVSENPVENGGKVLLRSAKDRHDEVLALALDIVDKVQNGGRYNKIEVFVSDVADYEAEIKATFARYEIPFFIDKKELLAEQTKVRYILDAIACARSGLRRREVLDFVKNPLFAYLLGGGEDDVFSFENYVLKYNIDRTRFEGEFTLKEERKNDNRHFIDTKSADKVPVCEYCDENVIPERVRKTLINTLSPYLDKSLKNVTDFVKASFAFLESAEDAWRAHVDTLTRLSAYYVKCAEQVDKKLDDVLGEIAEVLNYDADVAEFESIFKSMIKTLKIALVPTYLDCVFVGDGDSRFMGSGDIYILGATNDKLPRVSGGGAVVSPKDEELFSKLGLEITPNESQKLMTDKYALCDLMKKPNGKLVISYPETGSAGALRPSTVISELKGMLSSNGKPIEAERISFENLSGKDKIQRAARLFATPKSCYFEVLKNAISHRAPIEDNSAYGAAYACMSDGDKAKTDCIFNTPERIVLSDDSYFAGSTSVSRLETFFTCPYSHYFNYILSLKKRKDGNAEGTENGTVLHSVLEKFFVDVRDGVIKSKRDIRQRAYEYFRLAIKENNFDVLLEKADTSRQLRRVREEGVRVCEDLFDIYLRSSFKPTLLEAKFGENGIQPMSLAVGDKKIRLKGTIDRVDVFGDKFIVVDYKTYKSADLKLDELYYGEKIQLYVYMKAVEESLKLSPSGVFYLPIFAGFTDENTSRYKFKGQVSDSLEIMSQIDEMAKDDPQKSVIPYKANTKGELNPEVHLDVRSFDMLGDYATRLAAKGAMEIASGFIKPSPVKDACKKCRFLEICAYRDKNERRLSKVNMQSFAEGGVKEASENE